MERSEIIKSVDRKIKYYEQLIDSEKNEQIKSSNYKTYVARLEKFQNMKVLVSSYPKELSLDVFESSLKDDNETKIL